MSKVIFYLTPENDDVEVHGGFNEVTLSDDDELALEALQLIVGGPWLSADVALSDARAAGVSRIYWRREDDPERPLIHDRLLSAARDDADIARNWFEGPRGSFWGKRALYSWTRRGDVLIRILDSDSCEIARTTIMSKPFDRRPQGSREDEIEWACKQCGVDLRS